MKVSDLYGEVANRLTLVLKQPYSEHELTVFQLECVLDCLTVFLGGLLAEARRNENATIFVSSNYPWNKLVCRKTFC